MHPTTLPWQKGTHPLSREETHRHYVLFTIERQHYALPLVHVVRALRMVALTPVPEAPEWIPGVINMAGKTVTAIDLRHLLRKKKRDPELQDRLLILDTKEQMVAVIVDEVLGILELTTEQLELPPPALSDSHALAATVRLEGTLVMVLETSRLLPGQGTAHIREGGE